MSTKQFIRFQVPDRVAAQDRVAPGRRSAYGLLEGDQVRELTAVPFDGLSPTGRVFALKEVRLLAPAEPSKILAVGLNYASHLGDRPRPERPELFLKPISAVLEPEGTIVIPTGTNQCEYEGELVVVVGREARSVAVAEADQYVFGVTCGNDVSARDWQKNDLQWWRAKGCDTFAPFGPVLVQGLDYRDLLLTTRLNGQVKQQQRTSDLIFSVPEILSFASRHVTLYPGDIIYTGTPGSTSPLQAGDLVEVDIAGVGVLRNRVARQDG